MARRILNRKDMRADYDAAERRKQDQEETEETDEVEEGAEDDEDEDEEEGEGEGDEEAAAGGDEEEEPEEEAPVKKKKKAPAKAKPRARTRTPKVTRMKVVWVVFNNSNQRVAAFDYPRRKEADDLATKLTADKKNTHFVQPVKEPIEEKKE